MHTASRARALRFAVALPVSRVVVNGPAAQGCIGLGSGLTPSLTLGCDAAGGTSTSDNVTYRHLLDITRVAQPLPLHLERLGP